MAKCPGCGAELPEDFGLIDCSQCGLGLLIEFDGVVRRRDDSDRSHPANDLQADAELVWSVSEEEGSVEDPLVIQRTSATIRVEGVVSEDLGDQGGSGAPGLQLDASDLDLGEGEIPLEPEPALQRVEPPGGRDSADLSDLEAFARASQGPESATPFVYDLVIEGIDTRELREAILEAMQDSRLRWDHESMLRQIHNGTLKIMAMSPVKASVFVRRVLDLPLRISWFQRMVSDEVKA